MRSKIVQVVGLMVLIGMLLLVSTGMSRLFVVGEPSPVESEYGVVERHTILTGPYDIAVELVDYNEPNGTELVFRVRARQ